MKNCTKYKNVEEEFNDMDDFEELKKFYFDLGFEFRQFVIEYNINHNLIKEKTVNPFLGQKSFTYLLKEKPDEEPIDYSTDKTTIKNNDPINNSAINNETTIKNNEPINNSAINNEPINNSTINNEEPMNNNLIMISKILKKSNRKSFIRDILNKSKINNILNQPISNDLEERLINKILKKSMTNKILTQPINNKESL